jgi:hypothetical protein
LTDDGEKTQMPAHNPAAGTAQAIAERIGAGIRAVCDQAMVELLAPVKDFEARPKLPGAVLIGRLSSSSGAFAGIDVVATKSVGECYWTFSCVVTVVRDEVASWTPR